MVDRTEGCSLGGQTQGGQQQGTWRRNGYTQCNCNSMWLEISLLVCVWIGTIILLSYHCIKQSPFTIAIHVIGRKCRFCFRIVIPNPPLVADQRCC